MHAVLSNVLEMLEAGASLTSVAQGVLSHLPGCRLVLSAPEGWQLLDDGGVRARARGDLDVVCRSWGVSGLPLEVKGSLRGMLQLPADSPEALQQTAHTALGVLRISVTLSDLARSAAEQVAILNTAVDAIVTLDDRGRIQSFNPGAERMFGYRAEEVLGRTVNMLMPAPYASEHDHYMQRYLTTGHRRIIGIGRQVTALRKDGTTLPVHLAVSEFRQDGARFFAGILRDITDLVEARGQVARLSSEMYVREQAAEQRAAREERRFISRELHDSVSQALFGIVLGTNAALQSLSNPEAVRASLDYVLTLAESGLAEMRSLILELRPESLESEGLLGTLARQARALARRYQLELAMQVPVQEPEVDLAVKHELFRIAMEALHNVVKHAQAAHLRLDLGWDQGELWLAVADDGVGFDPDLVEPGRVGLASIRERVEGLKGRLEIRSLPGQGTTLEARFPLDA